MSEATTWVVEDPEGDVVLSPDEVLAAARAEQAREDAAAARKLWWAAVWADAHPAESIADAACHALPGLERGQAIAGEGCPLVAEFAIPELGAVIGRSTPSAKGFVGAALELRHRLPRLWAMVHTGRLQTWRACRIAEATIHADPPLPPEVAGWVDRHLAPVAATCGIAQVDRLVAEAIHRFDLAPAPGSPAGRRTPTPTPRPRTGATSASPPTRWATTAPWR